MTTGQLWLTVPPMRDDPDDEVWLVTVMERFIENRLDWACSTIRAGRDPEAVVNDLVTTQVAIILTEPEMLAVWRHGLALVGPDDRRRLLHLHGLYVEEWARALRAVRPDLDHEETRVMAGGLVAMLDSPR